MMNRRDFLRCCALTGGLWVLGDSAGLTCAAADQGASEWPNHPFLQGNFAPVQEEITVDNLQVIGTLPPEMDGMFVRNGPNPQFPPLGNYHWFFGDGMLHGVRVQGGKASYRNRYVRTARWQEEHAAGRALYDTFQAPPEKRNRANTALVWHAGRLLALYEGGPPHRIAVPELDTLGLYTFGGKLVHPFTAHPKLDPASGELLCFGYSVRTQPHLQYSVINAQGDIVSTTPIDLPRPIMMHDFAITPSYTLFMDLPMVFTMSEGLRLQFAPELGARIGILPRHGTGDEIKWFEVPTCWVFHTLNAYEDGAEVVLRACRFTQYPDMISFQPGTPTHPTDGKARSMTNAPFLYQWRFNLKTGRATEGPLDDIPTEFPRINEALTGKRTRFGYCGRSGGVMFDGLIKYDLDKGTSEHHTHGQGRTGGEGVFVPRPDATGEDDGWLVTYVHNAASGKSELVVIETRDFRAPPVARVLLPVRVPYGFHGTWITSAELARQQQ
jgi:carotenoid cleavage dioxygenase